MNWYRFMRKWAELLAAEPVKGLAAFLRTLLATIQWLWTQQPQALGPLETATLEWVETLAAKLMPAEEGLLESPAWLRFVAWTADDLRLEDKGTDPEGAGATRWELLEALARNLARLTTDSVVGAYVLLERPQGLSMALGQKFTVASYLAGWYQVLLYSAALGGEHVGLAGSAAEFQARERERYWADKDPGGSGQPSYPPWLGGGR